MSCIFICYSRPLGLRTEAVAATRTKAQGHTRQPSLPRRGASRRRLPGPESSPQTVPSPAQTYLLGLMANRLCLSREGQFERENLEVREITMRGVKLKCRRPSREIASGWVTGPIRDWGLTEGAQKGHLVVRRGPGTINTGQDAQPGSPGWKYWGHSKNNYPAWFALQVL